MIEHQKRIIAIIKADPRYKKIRFIYSKLHATQKNDGMSKKYVLDDTATSDQVTVIILSISVSCFFFLFLLIGWNWAFIIMGIMPMFFYIPVNIFMKRFSEIYTDGSTFFVKNLYMKEMKIDAPLFDRIADMPTIIWYPDSPYYTIYFKNGMEFYFVKKRNTFLGFPMKSKTKLAEELTKEVKNFLAIEGDFSG